MPSPDPTARRGSVRFSLPFAFALSLAFAPEAHGQVVLAPGQFVEFAGPDDCTSGTIVPNAIEALGGASSACDLANARIKAQVRPILGPGYVGFQTIHAFATLTKDFQVSAEPGTEGNTVGAWISYDVDWAGRILLIGFLSKPSVEMSIRLIDLTEGKAIQGQAVWARDDDAIGFSIPYVPVVSLNVGGGRDDANASSTFPAVLKRGHSYRIALRMECVVFSDGGLDVGTECDYFDNFPVGNAGGGLGLTRLAVKLGVDESVVLDQLEDVARLRQELDRLRGEFDVHGHAYLTGHGVGHNNAEAETSGPLLPSGPTAPVPLDHDADGIPDGSDTCAGTGAGPVDASGCSQAQFCARETHPNRCGAADWGHDDDRPRDCRWRRGTCEVR